MGIKQKSIELDSAVGEQVQRMELAAAAATMSLGFVCLDCDYALVTEIGLSAETLTGAGATAKPEIRERATLGVGLDDTGTSGWTVKHDVADAYDLTAAGVKVYRPTEPIRIESFLDSVSGKRAVFGQLRAVVSGTTPAWTGSMWIKYKPFNRRDL